MRLYIGIDPGLSGAVAAISSSGRLLAVHDTPAMPVLKSGGGKRNTYLVPAMCRLLRDVAESGSSSFAAIEYQASRPGQGAPATFSQGYGYGLWCMALSALEIPFEIVNPRTWKKDMRIPVGADKSASLLMASQLFPHAELTTVRGRKLDGRAEAILIAEFIRRKLRRGQQE